MDEIRGGARGGQNQFAWDSIKDDRNRICYLGNSVKAPVGRWQMKKDLDWFQKLKSQRLDMPIQSSLATSASSIKDEQALLREKEKELMANALLHGFGSNNSTTTKLSPSLVAATLELFEDKPDKLPDAKYQHTRHQLEKNTISTGVRSTPSNETFSDILLTPKGSKNSPANRDQARKHSLGRTNYKDSPMELKKAKSYSSNRENPNRTFHDKDRHYDKYSKYSSGYQLSTRNSSRDRLSDEPLDRESRSLHLLNNSRSNSKYHRSK